MLGDPIIVFAEKVIDPKSQYVLSMIIFIAIPFILYVAYSIYFWKKRFDFRKIHNVQQYKPMPRQLRMITTISKMYIVLNLLTGGFSLYSTIQYRDEIKPERRNLMNVKGPGHDKLGRHMFKGKGRNILAYVC